LQKRPMISRSLPIVATPYHSPRYPNFLPADLRLHYSPVHRVHTNIEIYTYLLHTFVVSCTSPMTTSLLFSYTTPKVLVFHFTHPQAPLVPTDIDVYTCLLHVFVVSCTSLMPNLFSYTSPKALIFHFSHPLAPTDIDVYTYLLLIFL